MVRRGSDPVEGRIPNNGDARPLIRQIVGCEMCIRDSSDDPEMLEQVAREKGHVKQDEIVYIDVAN